MVLEIIGLRSGYNGVEVVRGVSLKLVRGEVLFVMGRNGAGKTTLLKTIVGHIHPIEGRIIIEGRVVTGWAPHKIALLLVGYVPQDRGVFARLTVEGNLRIAERLNDGIVEEAYRLFPELEILRERRGGELSGGEQQILAVARALASRPRLLVMDEPATGLMPPIIRRLADAIKKLSSQGTSAIIVEQNPALVFEVADRLALMENGKITAVIERDRLLENQSLLRNALGLTYSGK
ncbi:MAG: ATP-binding cassette domain-containing protein [Nitrososphaerota archaeon]